MRPFDSDRLDARDPDLIARVLPAARAFARAYFRLRVDGLHHLGPLLAAPAPALGGAVSPRPIVFASNHNGGIAGPDLGCTLSTLWSVLGPAAPLYALAHDFAMRQLTPLGRVLQRFGAVRASADNAARILAAGASFLVYPGGDLDAYRHARRRDEVVLGPRAGFVRAAQRAGAAIVPIVAHGAHRSAYIFHEGEGIARALRMKGWARLERFPLALALPWGLAPGPWLPYAPLPFPIRLRMLAPVTPRPEDDPRALLETIRASMQAALDAMAKGAAS